MIDPSRYSVLERSVSLVGGTEKVVDNNSRRVSLIIGFAGFAGTRISTKANMGVNDGLTANASTEYFEFTWNKHGSLVCNEWFANGMVGAVIKIFEVVENPGEC